MAIELSRHTGGKVVTAYGQTEVTRDLCDAREAAGQQAIYQADAVELFDFDTDSPHVTYRRDGIEHRIDCDLIAGCDGYHGASAAVPEAAITTYEKLYPWLAWLPIPCLSPARSSMQTQTVASRYVQCAR